MEVQVAPGPMAVQLVLEAMGGSAFMTLPRKSGWATTPGAIGSWAGEDSGAGFGLSLGTETSS